VELDEGDEQALLEDLREAGFAMPGLSMP